MARAAELEGVPALCQIKIRLFLTQEVTLNLKSLSAAPTIQFIYDSSSCQCDPEGVPKV